MGVMGWMVKRLCGVKNLNPHNLIRLMQVKDIKEGKVDSIELEIEDMSDERNVRGRFGNSRVCDATGTDETGSVKITLWNNEIDMVKKGSKVRITNGWAKEWNSEMQLSAGRYGKLEIVK
jgi:replication factor A1